MQFSILLYADPNLEQILSTKQIAFQIAEDIDEIVDLHHQNPNSILLLSDDSLDAICNLLQALGQYIPITALPRLVVADNHNIATVLSAGATDVLRKPLNSDELYARIKLTLQQLPQALSGSMELLIHDFNSSLGITEYSLNLLIEILNEGGVQAQPELGQLTRNVLRSNVRLRAMLFDLLDYSRLLANTYEVARQSFDLLAMVDRVINDASKIAHENNISIALDVNEELDTIKAYGDETLLSRALFAALDTSIKFCQPGSDIMVQPTEGNGYIQLQVTDNGQPVAANLNTEDVFDLSLGSVIREQGSRSMVGLSLPFCRAAMRAMGGDVAIESTPTQTVLTLHLPN